MGTGTEQKAPQTNSLAPSDQWPLSLPRPPPAPQHDTCFSNSHLMQKGLKVLNFKLPWARQAAQAQSQEWGRGPQGRLQRELPSPTTRRTLVPVPNRHCPRFPECSSKDVLSKPQRTLLVFSLPQVMAPCTPGPDCSLLTFSVTVPSTRTRGSSGSASYRPGPGRGERARCRRSPRAQQVTETGLRGQTIQRLQNKCTNICVVAT